LFDAAAAAGGVAAKSLRDWHKRLTVSRTGEVLILGPRKEPAKVLTRTDIQRFWLAHPMTVRVWCRLRASKWV